MADVSVVIPCYNGERFIADTIESVLAQTDQPKEVIVIDDGSTDAGARIVSRYESSTKDAAAGRVTLIKQPNSGESRARNVGIERATGKYIAFLDADDLWLPEKIARQVRFLDSDPQVVGVHTRVFNFENDLDDHARAETERTKDDPSVQDLISYHYISPSTFVVRRDVLMAQSIRFDEQVRHSEDMLFLADVRLSGTMRLIDEPLVAKRIHAGQQTNNPWHTIYSLENRADWCARRAEQLGPDTSAQMISELHQELVKFLEDRYWRRNLQNLATMRDYVGKICPQLMARSTLAGRRIYPRWVYKIKDKLGGRPS